MNKKERAYLLQEVFDEVYSDAKCSLDYETEHELLVAVQLSAQCTDARVNIVTKELLELLLPKTQGIMLQQIMVIISQALNC